MRTDEKKEIAGLLAPVLLLAFRIWLAVVWCYGLWVGAVEEHWSQGTFLLVVGLGTAWFAKENRER